MNLAPEELGRLADLAVAAATEAGEMIAGSRPVEIGDKGGGASLASRVVTEVDRRAESLIVERLDPTRESCGFALLTEEREDDGGRLLADHFWCVDPLDGTLPFIEGTPGYAVSIALVARDGTPLIGAIYDPVGATSFLAIRGGGAFRNAQRWGLGAWNDNRPLSVFADRSFLATADHVEILADLEQVAAELGCPGVVIEATAGAVMNACGVLAARPACYFKRPVSSGGGGLWDFAATACLFDELGAVATDIHGDRLDLNRSGTTSMNHRGVLFATDERIAVLVRDLAARRAG